MIGEMQRYREQQSKAYLQEIRDLFIHVRALQAEIDVQRETAAGLTGIDYTKLNVAASANGDAIPNAVARLVDLIRRACADLSECAARQDEARRCLDEMGGIEADILKLRYLLAMSWKGVAATLGYSVDRLKVLHRDALFCFYDYMPAHARDPKHRAL